jgi:hypothetical protein
MPPAAGWSTGDVEALEALAVVLVVEVDAGDGRAPARRQTAFRSFWLIGVDERWAV